MTLESVRLQTDPLVLIKQAHFVHFVMFEHTQSGIIKERQGVFSGTT